MTSETNTAPFKPGDVVVVTAPGWDTHLATVDAYNGARCMISYMGPHGHEHTRGEFTENLRLASHEERLDIPVVGQRATTKP